MPLTYKSLESEEELTQVSLSPKPTVLVECIPSININNFIRGSSILEQLF